MLEQSGECFLPFFILYTHKVPEVFSCSVSHITKPSSGTNVRFSLQQQQKLCRATLPVSLQQLRNPLGDAFLAAGLLSWKRQELKIKFAFLLGCAGSELPGRAQGAQPGVVTSPQPRAWVLLPAQSPFAEICIRFKKKQKNPA